MKRENQENKDRLSNIEKEIRDRDARIRDHVFHIGGLLWDAKSIVGHGDFKKWVKSTFDFSYTTANNCMNVFIACQGKEHLLTEIKKSVLYQVSAPGYPKLLKELMLSNPDVLKDLKSKDVKELGKRVSEKGGELNDREIRKLINLNERKIKYHSYHTKLKQGVSQLENLSEKAVTIAESIKWPVSTDNGKTLASKNIAEKIEGIIKDIQSAIKAIRPSIQIVGAKKIKNIEINFQ